MNHIVPKCVAEFIGTFALIFIGVGAISVAGGNLLAVAFAHGLTIAVMVSATGHISGGHLNPAVTLGLLVGKKIKPVEAAFYWIAQLAGGVAAAFVCLGLFNKEVVRNGTPALMNSPLETVSASAGFAIEMITTFFLVFVVYGTAVDDRGPKLGGLAIGLTVTLDILFAGPRTGAAMNPARAFGPAVAGGLWTDHWVYWAGPLAGGVLAGLVYAIFFLSKRQGGSAE